jgi:DnaK suppressor protein
MPRLGDERRGGSALAFCRLSEQTTPSDPRPSLEEERVALNAQLGELDVDGDANDFDENFADSAQVTAEKGENRALAGSLREQLDDVDRALAKLDDGTYGQCENCGQPIGEARLEAMPATRFCITCAANAGT